MKKLIMPLILLCFFVGFVNNCAKRIAPVTQVPERQKGKPNWVPTAGEVTVFDQDIAEGKIIQGIGVSEYKPNIRAMRQTAIADAMNKLAQQVKVHLEGVTRVTMGNWSDFLQKDAESSIEEVKEVIKSIVDVELQGPKPMQEYQDKETGQYWVRVLMSAATTERWLKEKLRSEAEMKRLFIEAKSSQINEELTKDIERLRQEEKAQQEKINALYQQK